MKVLVTGGAGFIGSELVRQLVAGSNEVTVVDNLVNGRVENLRDVDSSTMNFVQADIRDIDLMLRLIDDVDVVYHLACLGVRHSIHSPFENNDVNATATLKLLEAAYKSKIDRFVYVSSSEVYGTAQWVPMTENHPTFPKTVYGSGKLAGECYTRAYFDTYGFPTVVVRPFNSFGPRCHHEGDSGEVIPKFMLRSMAGKPMMIFGDGSQTRDFTFVEDTARGIIMAGNSDKAIGNTLNIGSGYEIRIDELARQVAQVVSNSEPVVEYIEERPGDVLRLFAETSRATELIGFKPTVTLAEGLQRLKTWYVESGTSVETLLEQEFVRNWAIGGETETLESSAVGSEHAESGS